MKTLRQFGIEIFGDQVSDVPRRVLWGVAPTGVVHLGYAAAFFVLQSLKRLGSSPVVLLANIHGYWDSQKSAWGEIERRSANYRRWLRLAGLDVSVETNTFYLTAEYMAAIYEISARLPLRDILHAGRTTLKCPPGQRTLGEALYVATQVLDVRFLSVDAVLCGQDEADIYRFGLPLLHTEYGHIATGLFLPMCPGIQATEMHSSDSPSNKIAVTDSPRTVQNKVQEHFRQSTGIPPLAQYACSTLFPLAGIDGLAAEITSALRAGLRDAAEVALAQGLNTLLKPWQ